MTRHKQTAMSCRKASTHVFDTGRVSDCAFAQSEPEKGSDTLSGIDYA